MGSIPQSGESLCSNKYNNKQPSTVQLMPAIADESRGC